MRSGSFCRWLWIVSAFAVIGCGGEGPTLASPQFTTNAASLIRLEGFGPDCFGYEPLLNVSSYNGICLPFNDAHLLVMGIGAGPNIYDGRSFAGMMPYTSTEFDVEMADGSKIRTSTDSEGFFALTIETQFELEKVTIYPKDGQAIVCERIYLDRPPCQ